MTGIPTWQIWTVILVLGLGSFGLRYLFLGIVGAGRLPPWALRHLRYTAVAVIPALIAPLTVWPQATGGQPDAARLTAAAVTLGVGYVTKSLLVAILSGAATLWLLLTLL